MSDDDKSGGIPPFEEKVRTQSVAVNAANLIGTCQEFYDKNRGLKGRKRESLRIYDQFYDMVLGHLPPGSERAFQDALWDVLVEERPAWLPLGGIVPGKKKARVPSGRTTKSLVN